MDTSLHFEDVEIGARFVVGERTVTEHDLVAFAKLSGDRHPVHVDAAWAAGSPFGQRIAHGPLGIAWCIGLFGRIEAFRETALAMTDISEWQFRAPIYIGDVLTLEVVIEAKRTTRSGRGILERRMRLLKADGTVAQEGRSGLLITSRGERAEA